MEEVISRRSGEGEVEGASEKDKARAEKTCVVEEAALAAEHSAHGKHGVSGPRMQQSQRAAGEPTMVAKGLKGTTNSVACVPVGSALHAPRNPKFYTGKKMALRVEDSLAVHAGTISRRVWV